MTAPARDGLLARLERDAIIAAVGMAMAAAVVWPLRPERPLGVLGGLLLMAVSYRGIRAGLDDSSATSPPAAADSGVAEPVTMPPRSRGPGFVKFFTRHAMLALCAYVMMARFEFDPMAMLAGVSAPAVAATAEVVRTVRARHSELR